MRIVLFVRHHHWNVSDAAFGDNTTAKSAHMCLGRINHFRPLEAWRPFPGFGALPVVLVIQSLYDNSILHPPSSIHAYYRSILGIYTHDAAEYPYE